MRFGFFRWYVIGWFFTRPVVLILLGAVIIGAWLSPPPSAKEIADKDKADIKWQNEASEIHHNQFGDYMTPRRVDERKKAYKECLVKREQLVKFQRRECRKDAKYVPVQTCYAEVEARRTNGAWSDCREELDPMRAEKDRPRTEYHADYHF